MGQVLVPAAHRLSCEFQPLPSEAAQLRALLSSAGDGSNSGDGGGGGS